MAIRKIPPKPTLYSVSETENKLIDFANAQRQRAFPKDVESDYNLILDKDDFKMIVDSIKNPQYDEKLAKVLKRKLIFD